MTEANPRARWSAPALRARLRRRHAAERRFRRLGLAAIVTAMASLAILLASIGWRGVGAFRTSEIRLDVHFAAGALAGADPRDAPAFEAALAEADFGALLRDALRARFPEVEGRRELRALQSLVSSGARAELREALRAEPSRLGRTESIWLLADDEVDLFLRAAGRAGPGEAEPGETARGLSAAQQDFVRQLAREGRVRRVFNTRFLTGGDSREPEFAGVWGAVMGSLLTLAVTLALVFPLGVSASVYLEEFAPRNRLTDLIEVNINNLAAVPSIVFGLLGLAVFLNAFGLPRSAPLVGGMTLALMTLPTIIISGRVAIQAVPPSIREAARGVGASPLQVVGHHVLPLALPGILTGTIIGMARALGETAPLLMIGMVAFVVDVPRSLTDAATVLPVQIYLWADSPERAFVEKTSGAILVLLAFLILMSAGAIILRRKFEGRT